MRQPLPLLKALLVIAAACIAHAPGLRAGWVQDDRALARDNPVVERGLAGIPDAFASDVARPLPVASFCLEAGIWLDEEGVPQAAGFHAVNLLLHALCSLLILLLLSKLLPGRPVLGVATALLFAVHPLGVGTVSRIAGRADLLALLFSLSALALWLRGRPATFPLAALAFFLALLSNEAALGLPFALLAVEAARPGGGFVRALHEKALGWGLLALGILVWALRWPLGLVPIADAFGTGIEGLGRVALGLFVPVGLVRDGLAVTDGGFDLAPGPPGVVLGALVILGAVVALLRGVFGRRVGPLGLGVLAATILGLVGALVAPAGTPLEARFAYVTAPPLFLLVGRLIEALLVPRARLGPSLAGVVGAAVAVVCLVGISWQEARAWESDAAFRAAVLERHPGKTEVYLRMSSRIRGDIRASQLLAATQPMTGPKRERLLAETTQGVAQAEALSRAALRRAPGDVTENPQASRAWRELGLVQLAGGRPAEAVRSLRASLALDPWLVRGADVARIPPAHASTVAETYRELARAEESLGEAREAAGHYEAALLFAQGDIELMRRAGRALIRARIYERGLVMLRRLLDADLDADLRLAVERELRDGQTAALEAAERHLKAGALAENEERPRDAILAYEQALAAHPRLLDAYGRLVYLRGIYLGDCRRGRALLEAARRVMDEDVGVGPGSAWRSRFDAYERELEKECGPDAEEDR